MAGPPAALLAFLGEAPSQNALRRPGSQGSAATGSAPPRRVAPPSSARRGNDDDSSDDEDSAPVYDGGFDTGVDALKAPIPKAEPVPELSVPKAEKDRAKRPSSAEKREKRPSSRGERVPDRGSDHQKEQRPSETIRPPRPRNAAPAGGPDVPGSNPGGGYLNGSFGGTPQARSRSFGATEKASLGQTSTPFPSSLDDMMGEGASQAARRSSQDTPTNQKQLHRSASGSRSNKSGDSRKNTPEVDALGLGSSGGKRRFNGRG